MNTLLFTVFILIIVLLDLAWGLILPAWVVISSILAYLLLATAEFDLIEKARGLKKWASKYSSGR